MWMGLASTKTHRFRNRKPAMNQFSQSNPAFGIKNRRRPTSDKNGFDRKRTTETREFVLTSPSRNRGIKSLRPAISVKLQ